MSEKDKPLEKHLQVREFGDSLYLPLTKFLKRLNIDKNQVAKVSLRDNKEIVITRPDN